MTRHNVRYRSNRQDIDYGKIRNWVIGIVFASVVVVILIVLWQFIMIGMGMSHSV